MQSIHHATAASLIGDRFGYCGFRIHLYLDTIKLIIVDCQKNGAKNSGGFLCQAS